MMPWLLLAVVIVVAALVVTVRARRRREPGMVNFRRHIDALSPEARREVADRVRRSLDDGKDR